MKETLIHKNKRIEYDAVLKDYTFIAIGYGTKYVVMGAIYDDKKRRFLDGALVRTSVVEEMFNSKTRKGEVVCRYVRTMNSVYKLE